jgi:tryptophanyl-tRNA synthetase
MNDRPVLLSGIQPSGDLNIGNYIGAVRNWVELQSDYTCLFMVADLHSITVRQHPEELRARCLSLVAQYLACGIDPEQSVLFIQSHVPQHTELSWILSCYCPLGELQRMTQFKEKSQKNERNLNAGLLTYPLLMAADILLYQTDLVPVGEDQKQHLELTRDLAKRMNSVYSSELLKVPKPYIPKLGARIMSLQDPTSKMSKSDENEKANLWLLDPPSKIEKKLKSAVTDSESEIYYDAEKKPGISNLLTLFSIMGGEDMSLVVEQFQGRQYGHLKMETAKKVVEFLSPVQESYQKYMQDQDYLRDLLREGARKATSRAESTLEGVCETLGLVRK